LGLDLFFALIQFDSEWPQTQQQFVCSFPMFFFTNLGRDVLNPDHIEKDCSRIDCPVMLDMIPYVFEGRSVTNSHWQLLSLAWVTSRNL
jgi:hypothetical protein